MDKELVVKKIVEKISNKYKISGQEVQLFIEERLNVNNELKELIASQDSVEKIERLSVYKNFVKKVTKDTYYSLRQYHSNKGDPEEEHISTKEREPFKEEFFRQLYRLCGQVKTIIDVGGGVFPLTFPFEKFEKLEHYVWVDKDKKAYEILSRLENPKLALFNHSIGEHPWEHYLPVGCTHFDLALLIKLISVVERQQKTLMPHLASIPAHTYLITSPKEAMVKKENIQKREERTLKDFISISGKKITSELDVPNEFGYFLSNT